MKFRRTGGGQERIRLQMTPMIDIVFQLLIFFLFTFKIVPMEGDFNIRMPLAAPRESRPDEALLPPMKLRLQADASGRLAAMSLNDNSFASFDQLHAYILALIGDDSGPGGLRESAEVELDVDSVLRYQYVIQAITAVSGHRTPEGDIIPLVEKIRFAPPRAE